MNETISTKQDLIRAILERDASMKSHGLTYVMRSHVHMQARLYMMKANPGLRQMIAEAYAEAGVEDSRKILYELRA